MDDIGRVELKLVYNTTQEKQAELIIGDIYQIEHEFKPYKCDVTIKCTNRDGEDILIVIKNKLSRESKAYVSPDIIDMEELLE